MLHQLNASNWPDLSSKQLTKLWIRNNIYLRMPPGKEEEVKAEAQKVVKKQIEDSISTNYGWSYAIPSAKLEANIFIS